MDSSLNVSIERVVLHTLPWTVPFKARLSYLRTTLDAYRLAVQGQHDMYGGGIFGGPGTSQKSKTVFHLFWCVTTNLFRLSNAGHHLVDSSDAACAGWHVDTAAFAHRELARPLCRPVR